MTVNYDVIVVGAGAAGLMTAQRLSQIGLSVVVIEQKPRLASGPSTRNEGWLHRGTYHAVSIRDRANALQVARRCIYGHKQLKAFVPEAIEDTDKRSIAILRDGDRLEDVISRWEDANVSFRQISPLAAASRVPAADFSRAAALFEVNDVSINTRLLYRKLLGTARVSGCTFLVAHRIIRCEGLTLELEDPNGGHLRVSGQRIVYTTGAETGYLFTALHKVEIPVRYWKSHLVVTKRLAPMGVFYLDAHEAAMMHHGEVSVIGFNEDAVLCDVRGYNVIPDRAKNLRQGIRKIFPSWHDPDAMDIACVKVDLVDQEDAARSLNVAIREPIPGHIVALPGKLTETPYLTDAIVAKIHDAIDDDLISARPCDRYAAASAMREIA
ncbi:NAD(P)/FAD-dependent oxidoreductase [Roseinatronobacter alkalisoli]|uniref:FAD-dependent oxidoreductase n=1 Tax=Roseinatronobacter alkalisoli TaxID=3028235 RepID=A0ABT5TA46_9RHOB|nr:FAD-dependent oxidoreductase [Roseinatronobacter sp. HJB301]MDD7971967.1 FAD-dependent oxidoreductase [Roseinatronobacter sp. HJB301]